MYCYGKNFKSQSNVARVDSSDIQWIFRISSSVKLMCYTSLGKIHTQAFSGWIPGKLSLFSIYDRVTERPRERKGPIFMGKNRYKQQNKAVGGCFHNMEMYYSTLISYNVDTKEKRQPLLDLTSEIGWCCFTLDHRHLKDALLYQSCCLVMIIWEKEW